jgi:hypothetical protein
MTKLDHLGRDQGNCSTLIRISKAGASVQGAVPNVVAGPPAEDYKREEITMRKIIIWWVYLGRGYPCVRRRRRDYYRS